MRKYRFAILSALALSLFFIKPSWCADYSWTENFAHSSDYTSSSAVEITVTDSHVQLNNMRNSLVAWWPMNEGSGSTVSDSSVNHYTGALTNETWIAGKVGPYAVSFNGTSTYLTASVPKPSLPFTIAFWVKPATGTPIGIFDTAPSTAKTLRNYPDGCIEWHSVTNGYPMNLSGGSWSHVVIVFKDTGNGYGGFNFYRNGVFVATYNTEPGLDFAWATSICFGNINGGSAGWYNGVLDEPAIWNRELSPAEIAGLYNNGNGWTLPATTYPTTGPSIQPNMSRGTWILIKWTSFSESANKPGGTEIKYQFSFDDGATWHYYTGSAWAAASSPANASASDQLTPAAMQALYPNGYAPANSQKIIWRAFLISDGANTPTLNSVTIAYQQTEATAFEWGAGAYSGGDLPAVYFPSDSQDKATLDYARWDWLTLSWVNNGLSYQSYWDEINAQLAMNPNQKLLVDLNFCDPTGTWGKPDRDHGAANMFDYRYSKYKAGTKAGLEQKVRDRVDFALNQCSRPQNVVGFVLMEEICGNFGWSGEIETDSSVMPPVLTEYQSQIEVERGKPLVWDEETKLWCGQVFIESMRDLHQVLKDEIANTDNHPAVSNVKVYLWDAVGCYLDDAQFLFPSGWTIWTPGIYPVTNQADLLFSAAGERLVHAWILDDTSVQEANRCLYRANKYNTPFAVNANHPSANRNFSWPDTLNIGKMNHPLNLGYYFYCFGACNNYPGDCPSLRDPNYSTDPADNVPYASCADHGRCHGAHEDIGMDIVRYELSPSPSANIALSGQAPGTVVPLTVLLENPATADYFTSADQAVAEDVELTLTLPAHCSLDPGHAGQSLTWNVGDMAAQNRQKHVWWVKIDQAVVSETTTMQVTSSNRPTRDWNFAGDSVIPSFAQHYIRRPSRTWAESAIGESSAVDIASWFDAIEPTDQPSLTIGTGTITYDNVLQPGQKILFSPWNSQHPARMYNSTLFRSQVGDSDPNPPYYKPFTGSDPGLVVVKQLAVYRNVTGLTQLKMTVDGMADAGVGSRIDCYFVIPPDSHIETVTFAAGAFGTEWSAVTETKSIPSGATQLASMVFCRNNPGSVWYGNVTVDNATYPETGVDVSSQMTGTLPAIPADDFSVVTYSDTGLISLAPKIAVQLSRRMSVNITTPINGAGYTAPATVNISASASSLNDAITQVRFYYNGGNLIAADTNGADGWSCAWNNAPAGFYTLTAVAYDATGSTTSPGVHIRVNGPPTVNITSPSQGASFTAPATINIAAGASDSDGGTIVKVEFYNNGILLGTDTNGADGWSYSWANVAASGATGIKLAAKAYDDLGVVTTSAQVSCTVTDSALKCYWKFDETSGSTAYDTSGAGNNGTLYSSPIHDSAGKVNYCLFFNGTNQYAQKTSATGLPAANANQTECFWYYVSSNPSATKTALAVTNNTSSTGSGVDIGFINSSGMKFAVWRNTNKTRIVTASALPTAGAWHHVAYVKSGSTNYLYIDGAAVSSTSGTDTSSAAYITGARTNYSSGANYWPGKMDEIRIYNRALSSTEIQALAQGKQ